MSNPSLNMHKLIYSQRSEVTVANVVCDDTDILVGLCRLLSYQITVTCNDRNRQSLTNHVSVT